ncbi:MAG: FG-GAP repeat domain-containing protein [Planctomycetaceae bacterium]
MSRLLTRPRPFAIRHAVLVFSFFVWLPTATVGQLPQPRKNSPARAGHASPLRFADVTADAQIHFRHHSPPTPEQHLHLTMGGGVAWLDLDHDEWPDLIFGQGCAWMGDPKTTDAAPQHDCLLRNVRGVFQECTDVCGLREPWYTMGLATADFNNDGFCDLALTAFGGNSLYLNNGDGTFDRLPNALPSDAWTLPAGCTWFDVDADGALDLYVTNYLQIDPHNYALCQDQRGTRTARIPCPPRKYRWPADCLYRNPGEERDAQWKTAPRSSLPPGSPALGVVTGDWNQDHHCDLYVANDTTANTLLINDGHGALRDQAVVAGVAFNRLGEPEAGMGVATGDIDGDGQLDLFVGNYFGESNTLYRNEGNSVFLDVTAEFGLAAPSRSRLTFGTLLNDFDNDGWLDVFVMNGHLAESLAPPNSGISFRQQPQVMRNLAGKRFVDASAEAGNWFLQKTVGRGCAAADFDNDGRIDVVTQHLNEPAALLRNLTTTHRHNLLLQITAASGNRDALGWVVLFDADGQQHMRQREGSSSYLSCNDGRICIPVTTQSTESRLVVLRADGIRAETRISHEMPQLRIVERQNSQTNFSLHVWNLPQ